MEPGIEVVKLSFHDQNAAEVESCDGILFSGGEDVHPSLYGKPEFVEEYGLKEIIPERDQFEYEVIEKALETKKPVLGICRGLQLINVYLGGTLLPDIPSLSQSTAHGKISGQDQIHDIRVESLSMLHNITGREKGQVNSAHHQGVDKPAGNLKISAFSEPSIVEAMEWKDPSDKSWLIAGTMASGTDAGSFFSLFRECKTCVSESSQNSLKFSYFRPGGSERRSRKPLVRATVPVSYFV